MNPLALEPPRPRDESGKTGIPVLARDHRKPRPYGKPIPVSLNQMRGLCVMRWAVRMRRPLHGGLRWP